MKPHPDHWCPSDEVVDGVTSGASLSEVIVELRRSGTGAAHIARALCVALDLDVAEAHARVLAAFPADEAVEWRAALDAAPREGVADWDREDASETFLIEGWAARLRSEGAGWFAREVNAAATASPPDQATLVGLSIAADRAACPIGLLPSLFDAARLLDASQCRAPLASIVRHHGPAPVEQEIAAMIGAGAPRSEVLAGMWRYWLPNL